MPSLVPALIFAGAQASNCKRDRLWIRVSVEMEYLIFSFLRPDVVAKRGVKLRHSTCNANTIIRQKWETEFLNTRYLLPTLCAGYSLKTNKLKNKARFNYNIFLHNFP